MIKYIGIKLKKYDVLEKIMGIHNTDWLTFVSIISLDTCRSDA